MQFVLSPFASYWENKFGSAEEMLVHLLQCVNYVVKILCLVCALYAFRCQNLWSLYRPLLRNKLGADKNCKFAVIYVKNVQT